MTNPLFSGPQARTFGHDYSPESQPDCINYLSYDCIHVMYNSQYEHSTVQIVNNVAEPQRSTKILCSSKLWENLISTNK
jgi:hypothetical protein